MPLFRTFFTVPYRTAPLRSRIIAGFPICSFPILCAGINLFCKPDHSFLLSIGILYVVIAIVPVHLPSFYLLMSGGRMPVRVVIAPDSFKGSMKSSEAAKRIQQGIQSVFPDWTCERIPVADGGEGTLDAILTATGGYKVPSTVQDPLGRMMRAEWGYCEDRKLAVIETAAASGLSLLTEKELDPYRASTFGTGQLVKEALDRGAQEVVLGLGGSATVDAGVGFFSALGVDFYNRAGMINRPAGGHLGEIEWMDVSRMDPRLKTVRMTIAFDVSNPLLGPEGAISIFGSQKGVQAEETAFFEAGMQRFAEQIIHLTGRDVRSDPGSGAARWLWLCSPFASRCYISKRL